MGVAELRKRAVDAFMSGDVNAFVCATAELRAWLKATGNAYQPRVIGEKQREGLRRARLIRARNAMLNQGVAET